MVASGTHRLGGDGSGSERSSRVGADALPQPITQATFRRAYGIASDFFAAGMDSDDLAQEALIGAVQARRSWRPGTGCSFGTFERRCMRRRVIDVVETALRSKRGSGVRELPLSEIGDRSLETCNEHWSAMADVRQLPVRQQRTLVRLAAGFSYVEIAAAEGVTTKRVDNDIRLARAELRRLAA